MPKAKLATTHGLGFENATKRLIATPPPTSPIAAKKAARKPWLVLCKDGRHYFASQSQVVKFIAQRKGKIIAIMYDGKLIREEIKIYNEGLKLAGLLD